MSVCACVSIDYDEEETLVPLFTVCSIFTCCLSRSSFFSESEKNLLERKITKLETDPEKLHRLKKQKENKKNSFFCLSSPFLTLDDTTDDYPCWPQLCR